MCCEKHFSKAEMPLTSICTVLVLLISNCYCEKYSLHISQGRLTGKSELDRKGNEYYSFISIPYAAPPLGDLRFSQPQAPGKWTGTLNATIPHKPCAQVLNGKLLGDEDCLYINVYTPMIRSCDHRALKPVMVFMHGGSFLVGNSQEFGPEFLMPAGVLLVTFNYRMGIFGFLSSDETALGISGNTALKDQNMALRWIKKNIKKFGGDPDNVTLMGESIGGTSAHLHTLSPVSRGLFHKVIAMSGTAGMGWTSGSPNNLERVGKLLGIVSQNKSEILRRLRDSSTEEILLAQKDFPRAVPVSYPVDCNPIVEKNIPGAFLTSKPLDIINSGNFTKLPFMVGYTDQEGLFGEVMSRITYGRPRIITNYSEAIPHTVNREHMNVTEAADQIRKFYYGEELPVVYDMEKTVDVFTGAWVIAGLNQIVKAQVRTNVAPIYFYRFSADTELNYFKRLTPATAIVKGAAHGEDLSYIFKRSYTPQIIPGSIEDIAIDNVVKLVTDFAKYGNPGGNWAPMTPQKFNYMEIGNNPEPGVNPDQEQFGFWDEFFNQYA